MEIVPVGAVVSERANVAVTCLLASIVTVQVPGALVHAPDHPVKVEPAEGWAVRVTEVQ